MTRKLEWDFPPTMRVPARRRPRVEILPPEEAVHLRHGGYPPKRRSIGSQLFRIIVTVVLVGFILWHARLGLLLIAVLLAG
jgi:hypothetical protein